MPRGPSTGKRQQGAANQRDTRHENGLVGPGKRVQKQKSNGHLNGHARTPESNSSTPPLPSTPPATNGYVRHSISTDNAADHTMAVGNGRKPSVSYSESSSDAYQNTSEGPAFQEHHRQIDVNATKNPAVHRDMGPLSLALTVLRSCPLGDTLAILIVLLQIPPTFLSIVHLLFATLTFVPSSNVAASGMTFTDILQGTLGTPSISTIIGIDVIVLLIWLFLWSPLQDIALDLAQTVIALTLGGGTSGKESGMKNVLWCFGIIGASHFIRTGNVKHSSLRAIISSNLGTPDPDDPLEPISYSNSKKHGLVRSILAIHILTQGVVRYIRDWYVRREKRDNSASIGDPEAGKVVDSSSDSASVTLAVDTDSSTTVPVGTPTVNNKKKKKQSVQVRIRQPLWAALASTKIVMVKEYETSHTAAESAGTNATDMNNLGNAPFNSEADRIWITYVGSDEVFFSTSFFPSYRVEGSEEEQSTESIIDRAKPFFVKVNNTVWQPTRINATPDPEDSTGQNVRWNGEIFGLAPTSTYHCNFISTVDQSILFSTTVRTSPSLTDPSANGLAPNPQVAGRPSSPLSTLKTSITQAEKKLEEDRQRQKSARKEQRSKLNSIRKEIERLASGIASTGGNDDKLKQKAQQSNLHMKQAEEAAVSLASQIELLDKTPSDETSQHTKAKREIQSQREKHKNVRSGFTNAKQAAEREVHNLKDEVSQVQQKCEAKHARLTILTNKHESITDANAKGLDEAQRKQRELIAKRDEREKIRRFYNERLQFIDNDISDGQTTLRALYEAISLFEQTQQSPSTSSHNLVGYSDVIPEDGTMNPNTYPWNGPGPTNMYSSAGYIPVVSTAGPSSSPGQQPRGRSSSMLSNVSKFTQSSDEGVGPSSGAGFAKLLEWQDAREERKASSGSGSGSASGAGSVADPKSPTVGNVKVAKW